MKRYLQAIAGWILIIGGIIVTPLPIPFGILMIAVGAALVAPTSPAIRRLIRKLRIRFPGFDRGLERAYPKAPRFVQVLIEQTRPEEPDPKGKPIATPDDPDPDRDPPGGPGKPDTRLAH